MLAKPERLGRSDFSQYFRRGHRYHSEHLTLVYSPAPDFRGAVVVGKKVARQAVERNRLRRRLAHALTAYARERGLTGAHIIITKPSVRSLPRRELPTHLEHLLAQVHRSS